MREAGFVRTIPIRPPRFRHITARCQAVYRVKQAFSEGRADFQTEVKRLATVTRTRSVDVAPPEDQVQPAADETSDPGVGISTSRQSADEAERDDNKSNESKSDIETPHGISFNYMFRKHGANFIVRFEGESGDISCTLRGAEYVHHLLDKPHKSIPAIELRGGVTRPGGRPLPPNGPR